MLQDKEEELLFFVPLNESQQNWFSSLTLGLQLNSPCLLRSECPLLSDYSVYYGTI